MRTQINKLRRGKSTKAERVFLEILKENHIPFRSKVKILGREVDFLIREKFIVEINGHEQESQRNNEFVLAGYVPIHFHNKDIRNNRHLIIQKLKDYAY